MHPVLSGNGTDIHQIVSAAAVPMTIVDYTAVIERFAGLRETEVRSLLSDETELAACLRLPRTLASSPEWIDLYGSPLADDTPDLPSRQFTPERYPALAQSMIDQLAAPFSGVASLVREHLAPSVTGDVVVRSHWKASSAEHPYSQIVIVDLDLTRLRETQRSLEAAVEAKVRMVATIAHELRNPITSLVGFSSILQSDWDDLDDESRREMASTIADQTTDVADLLEDLMAAAAGAAIPVENRPLELDDVLAAADLTGLEVEAEKGLIVRGDALRIRQIIRNLVENARRYGGPRQVLSVRADHHVVVEVSDDGEGLAPGLAERLFQPLATGGTSGSLGLGLSVARGLARAMGGDLRFQRRDGWSVFTLILRRAAPL